MYRKAFMLTLSFILVFTILIGITPGKSFAFKTKPWKLSFTTVSYKWGASLKDGIVKTGWKNAASSWKSKTSSNVNINFFYHKNSVHFLTRFTEKDSNYYGKMNTAYNTKTKIVTKYAGYLNDYAIKNSKVAQSTGVHELGHALGLDHNNNVSIMNSSRDRKKIISPQTDDINGVKSIYRY